MNIFDDGAVELVAQALEILVATEALLVVNDHQDPTKDDVRQYGFALCGEVHELCDELGWKGWKLDKEADYERSKDEYADILAFLGVMTQLTNRIAGTSCTSLAHQFRAKSQVNIDRINLGKVPGYGGPLTRGPQARGGLEVGGYYQVSYHGQQVMAHLSGRSDDGICCFYLTEVDKYGLSQWFLAESDPNWVAVANG